MGPGRNPSRDDELNEELQSHLEMAKREAEERGLSAEEAEIAARREMGNEIQIKEVTRRSLAFSTAAVVTLALGIGASAAVFGIVNAVVLRPLRFRDRPPGRIPASQAVRQMRRDVAF